MFSEVNFLREAFSAVLFLTDVGLFLGMHSEVVKEIVPFSKYLIAGAMLAFQNFDYSLGARVSELENHERSRRRNEFVDI